MARSLNGSSDYLSAASAPVTATPLTLSCWMYPTSLQVSYPGGVGASGNFQFSLLLINDGSVIFRTEATGTADATASTLYSANQWSHIAGVSRSATDRSAYLNGGSKGNNTTSKVPSGINQIRFGSNPRAAAPGAFFGGSLAEWAIWDIDLSDAEIAVLARGLSPMAVRPGNLVGYWPLVGRSSPEKDIVGNFNLTLTGTAAANHPRIIYPARRRSIFVPGAAPPSGRIWKLAGNGGGLVGRAGGLTA